jgi:tetratricopeptide (TPR) repeat protein
LQFDTHSSACGATNTRIRIVRRDCEFRWHGRVHETLDADDAPAIWLADAWVEHRPPPGLGDHKRDRDRKLMEAALVAGERRPGILFHYGLLLADQEEYEAAIDILEECLIVCPAVGPRYLALTTTAGCRGETGDTYGMLDDLHEAIALDPTRAEAFVQLGQAYSALGHWSAAAPFFGAALEARPPAHGPYAVPPYTWAAFAGLASCVAQLGDPGRALKLLDEAVGRAPHCERKVQPLRQAILKSRY